MGLIVWITLGLAAGALASFTLPDRKPGGIVPVLVGAVGAALGGSSGSLIGVTRPANLDLAGIVAAASGSILFLAVWAWMRKPRSQGRTRRRSRSIQRRIVNYSP